MNTKLPLPNTRLGSNLFLIAKKWVWIMTSTPVISSNRISSFIKIIFGFFDPYHLGTILNQHVENITFCSFSQYLEIHLVRPTFTNLPHVMALFHDGLNVMALFPQNKRVSMHLSNVKRGCNCSAEWGWESNREVSIREDDRERELCAREARKTHANEPRCGRQDNRQDAAQPRLTAEGVPWSATHEHPRSPAHQYFPAPPHPPPTHIPPSHLLT